MFNISQEVIIYTLGVISLLSLALLIWNIRLERKVRTLCRGKNMNIEDAISDIERDLKGLGVFRGDIEKYLTTVEKRLKKSVQGVGNTNFKAFKGMDSGGQQSFATAFLNEEGSGVILSTIHTRDRVNVFSKPIVNFKCHIGLSDEERDALTKAQQSCKL